MGPDGETFVRPFMVTGGRTRPDHDLRLETVIEAVSGTPVAEVRFEQSRVIELCRVPQSVAEIAAVLGLPLGVARIVVADLLAAGRVRCQSDPAEVSIAALERILAGIRAL
ncbi:MAG TPA: DUF742 domain-containing protein [Actinoplanes sp.]|nr:DUF742 domain-containing protein [Actinoplanes sp.]